MLLFLCTDDTSQKERMFWEDKWELSELYLSANLSKTDTGLLRAAQVEKVKRK